MELKHTPGPWTYEPAAIDSCGAIVAKTRFVCDFVEDPTEDDARLIAAAPLMLEALQNLENDDGSIPAHAWSLVQDAIAKATQQEVSNYSTGGSAASIRA